MRTQQPDIIAPEEAITLHGLFLERVIRTPEKVAYRYFDGRQRAWNSLTWAEAKHQLALWQAALHSEGLRPGEKVAVMLRNCPQWVIFEQAALSLGLVVVPLYTVDRADNIAFIVGDAQVRLLLFESEEQWGELRSVLQQLAGVRRFVSLDKIAAQPETRLQCVHEWLPADAELRAERFQDRDELATIIYTSGTTGRPKGVMLSHYNILYNAYASCQILPVGPDDCALSFLPLSHTFERTAGYVFMMVGAEIAYARSIPLLPEDLRVIRPTVLVSVPRIYERIYNVIHAKLEERSPLEKKMFLLAVNVGWERFEYAQGRNSWKPKLVMWPILKYLVADKVMDRLGGRVRFSISGGAALPPKVSQLFIALGLPLIQGYGLTETSPVVSANHIENNHPSSVGLPLPGIEVRIGAQNALLVRGPSNMLGYWNNLEATKAIVDHDGWLNTGDTASIAESGHIYITGRLKEIIVMSNGEKVPPADIEDAITKDPLFDQVMVYGEARPMLVALAVLNPEQWHSFAKNVGVRSDMPESLHDSRIEERVLARISDQIKEFPGYANVRRVLLLTEPWTIENGMLTPTLKLKRSQVAVRFAKEIDSLYEGR
jgi:long-chain acyl-CoA synthetase